MRRCTAVLFPSIAIALLASPALSAIAGYTEDFNSGLGGWGGGATLDVITTGGVGGAGWGWRGGAAWGRRGRRWAGGSQWWSGGKRTGAGAANGWP